MTQRMKINAAVAERVVLASMIHPPTAQAAAEAARASKLGPEHFRDEALAALYRSFLVLAQPIPGGMIDRDTPAAAMATGDADQLRAYMRRMISAYKQHQREIDRTLAEFPDPGKDEDDEDCLFGGRWLRRGGFGMIVSTSGVGKSSFTMQAAAHWAEGEALFGIKPTKPLKIGIIQSEDDDYDVANFRNRIRIGLKTELKWPAEKIAEAEGRITFLAWNFTTGENFAKYVRQVQEKHHFDLLIANPLSAFFGGDITKNDQVDRFFRENLDPVVKAEDTKCGFLFVHHTGKPNREKLQEGDAFAAYIGNGASALTNFMRVAVAILPWKDGKASGVFELIAAKHGDRLGWKDADGKPTNKRVICYANRLERHKTDGAIYWVAPDADDMEELEAIASKSKGDPKDDIKRCADAMAAVFKAEKVTAPASWTRKKDRRLAKWGPIKKQAALNLIAAAPMDFGLVRVEEKNLAYYVADPTVKTDAKTTPKQTQQELPDEVEF